MSKVDAQRAMREAKYAARNSAGSPTRREASAVAPTGDGLCGHKSMNGRACTREAGHPEKNHRYG